MSSAAGEKIVGMIKKRTSLPVEFETANPGDGRIYKLDLGGRNVIRAKGIKNFERLCDAFAEGCTAARFDARGGGDDEVASLGAHTPGPLKEQAHYTVRSPRVDRIELVDADGIRVATVLADDTEQVENCTILEVVSRTGKANAAEIVRRWNAHKDLLEFAANYLRSQDDCIRNGDTHGCECVTCVLNRSASAAVAKAVSK